MKKTSILSVILFVLCSVLLSPTVLHAEKLKVLVVMSYEQDNPWCREIKNGIDSVLTETSEITYFYMDTKKNLEGGKQKAREAYDLFLKLQPDGVITVDDNAQSLFVVPYLKKKVSVPIMFCGVNAEAEQYGYPTSHISGILERGHIREGMAFAKLLLPSLESVFILAKESPSGRALVAQVQREKSTYVSKTTTVKLVKTMDEVKAVQGEIDKADAIFLLGMAGIKDSNGDSMGFPKVLLHISQMFPAPIIGVNRFHVTLGALCAVAKTGLEQGSTAGSMLLEAMQGIPVGDIPIRQNYQGKRVINVTIMKKMGITPKPAVLLGTELVTSR